MSTSSLGKKTKCDATYHRYYSLEPQATDTGSHILVISICSNCGDVQEYRTSIKVPKEK